MLMGSRCRSVGVRRGRTEFVLLDGVLGGDAEHSRNGHEVLATTFLLYAIGSRECGHQLQKEALVRLAL